MGRKKHLLSIVGAAVLCASSLARADISGHTNLAFGGFPSWSATNNWAVLSPGSALRAALTAVGFTAGTGSGGWGGVLATDYIYLYQETSDAGSTTLHEFTNSLGTPLNSSPVSPKVWGQFGGMVMQDAGGNVSAANDLDVITGIAASGGLISASSVTLGPASYIANWGTTGLAALQVGSLFVYVSPYAPATFTGSLQDGGAAVFGDSPAPAPIPSPGAALLGIIGLAPMAWRRRTA